MLGDRAIAINERPKAIPANVMSLFLKVWTSPENVRPARIPISCIPLRMRLAELYDSLKVKATILGMRRVTPTLHKTIIAATRAKIMVNFHSSFFSGSLWLA